MQYTDLNYFFFFFLISKEFVLIFFGGAVGGYRGISACLGIGMHINISC